MDTDYRTAFVSLAGLIVTSFVFTSVIHLTVGKDACEKAKSFQNASETLGGNGNLSGAMPSDDEACPSLIERWLDTLISASSLAFWLVSVLGGALAAGIYRRMVKP